MDEFRSKDTEGILEFLVGTAYAIFADHSSRPDGLPLCPGSHAGMRPFLFGLRLISAEAPVCQYVTWMSSFVNFSTVEGYPVAGRP
jgi:hypothetical protein